MQMVTHIMSLTYVPKIEAVKAGTIRQTIRLQRSLNVKRQGDGLILHTWAGKPYRSQWDWRIKTTIKEVTTLLYQDGKWWDFQTYQLLDDADLRAIAARDGIEEPTRENLEATLKKLNGLESLEFTIWDVVSW